MKKIYVRWQDLTKEGRPGPIEETLEGENVGYDLYEKDPEQKFVRIWADDKTLLLYQNRVIVIAVNKK